MSDKKKTPYFIPEITKGSKEGVKRLHEEFRTAMKNDALNETVTPAGMRWLRNAYPQLVKGMEERGMIAVQQQAEPTIPMEVLRITYAPDMSPEKFARMWPKFKAWQQDKHVGQACGDSAEHVGIQQAEPMPPQGWRERLQEMRDASYTYSQYPELAHTVFDSVIDALEEMEVSQQQAEPGADDLAPMPPSVVQVTRRIRRCESDVTAQLVLEHFAMEYARAAQSGQRAGVAEGDVLSGWVFEHRVDDGVCVVKSPNGSRFVAHPGTPAHELITALMTEPSAAAPTQQQEGGKE